MRDSTTRNETITPQVPGDGAYHGGAVTDIDGNSSSALCMACGLCCNGVLFEHGAVAPEDVARVRSLGLTVEVDGGKGFRFQQPCPLHQDGPCSAYPHHPPSCQAFRCSLLAKYEAGGVTFAESLAIVRTVKELANGDSTATLRSKLAWGWDAEHGLPRASAKPDRDTSVALQAATLDVLLTKHFR